MQCFENKLSQKRSNFDSFSKIATKNTKFHHKSYKVYKIQDAEYLGKVISHWRAFGSHDNLPTKHAKQTPKDKDKMRVTYKAPQ